VSTGAHLAREFILFGVVVAAFLGVRLTATAIGRPRGRGNVGLPRGSIQEPALGSSDEV
jgi:hypothetical protein